MYRFAPCSCRAHNEGRTRPVFGYLTPYKPEMKILEFECYRGVYCGLCKQLAADYGFVARMFLNYDLVLVSLLADGLSGQAGRPGMQRCIVNPVRRCMLADTDGLRLAADGLVLTVWYKLADDAADEPFARRLAARLLRFVCRRMHKKAASRQPEIDQVLAEATRSQQQAEADATASYDRAADATARMTGCLFAACAASDEQKPVLERMGSFLGRIIYFLDAAEDFEEDARRGRYNVFLRNGLNKQQADEEARRQCRMAAAEAARCYQQLPLRLNKPIWDNILYLGLPQSIRLAGQPRRRQSRHPS